MTSPTQPTESTTHSDTTFSPVPSPPGALDVPREQTTTAGKDEEPAAEAGRVASTSDSSGWFGVAFLILMALPIVGSAVVNYFGLADQKVAVVTSTADDTVWLRLSGRVLYDGQPMRGLVSAIA